MFDLNSLEITSPEIKIFEGICVNAVNGKASYSVRNANNGTIAYIASKLDTAKYSMVWYNKNGPEKKAITTEGPYTAPVFSKNGQAIVTLIGSVLK